MSEVPKVMASDDRRIRELFASDLCKVQVRIDQFFAILLALEVLGSILTALWISPYSWVADQRMTPSARLGFGLSRRPYRQPADRFCDRDTRMENHAACGGRRANGNVRPLDSRHWGTN
jgi:hypothetical protein